MMGYLTGTKHCINHSECQGRCRGKSELLCDHCEIVARRICQNLTPMGSYKRSDCDKYEVNHGGHCTSEPKNKILHRCLELYQEQSYGTGGGRFCRSCNTVLDVDALVIQRRSVQFPVYRASTVFKTAANPLEDSSFIILPSLAVVRASATSALQLLQSVGSDPTDVDMKEVQVGKTEILLLVKAAFTSSPTPLTDVFEPLFVNETAEPEQISDETLIEEACTSVE